ncbi:putative ubiquitin carboxyl-terminal hydrolase FAF-X [Crenichthys baileyi]|uniref:Ubiquitin carboxyl-terminal hydrolase FAF-X n=1 Tax=Crenichthys baileyi TaxID=28760 RepID=A0AAV9QTM1_9TELE
MGNAESGCGVGSGEEEDMETESPGFAEDNLASAAIGGGVGGTGSGRSGRGSNNPPATTEGPPSPAVLLEQVKLREAAARVSDSGVTIHESVLSGNEGVLIRWLEDRLTRGEESVNVEQFCEMLESRDAPRNDCEEAFGQFDAEGDGVVDIESMLIALKNSNGANLQGELSHVIRQLQACSLTPGFVDIFSKSKDRLGAHASKILKFLHRNRIPSSAIPFPILEGYNSICTMRSSVVQDFLEFLLQKEKDLDIQYRAELDRDPDIDKVKVVTQCYSTIETSSNVPDIYKMTNGETSSFWQSDGSARSHWIRLKMKPDVVLRRLGIAVASNDHSYMPQLVSVSVGKTRRSLQEIRDIRIPSNVTGYVALLENANITHPYVQINIKRCLSDGCDTRIHGLKTLGYQITKSKEVSVSDASAIWYLSLLTSLVTASMQTNPALAHTVLQSTQKALQHMPPLSLTPSSTEFPKFFSLNILEEVDGFLLRIANCCVSPDAEMTLLAFALARGSVAKILQSLSCISEHLQTKYKASSLIVSMASVRLRLLYRNGKPLQLHLQACDVKSKEEKSGPENMLTESSTGDGFLTESGRKKASVILSTEDQSNFQVTQMKIKVRKGAIGAKCGLVFAYMEEDSFDAEKHFKRFKKYDSWNYKDYKEFVQDNGPRYGCVSSGEADLEGLAENACFCVTVSPRFKKVVIQGSDDIASRAIDLLKEIYTNLGPKLQVNQVEIHEDFIQSCFDRLKASYDTLCVLDGDKDSINCARQEAIRMVRVLTVLKEYINECDSDYHEERTILPMSRAFRGKHITLIVRFPNQGRQVDDLDIWSHTNDTIGSVRRGILNRIKANAAHTKIELFIGGEVVDPADDRKLIGQLNLKDKTLITAKLTQVSANMPSSPDSSSDSSTGSPGNHGNHYSEGPNPEVESCLPGVIMSLHPRYISFLWQVADLGCNLNMSQLRDGARVLMKLMPPDNTTVENLRAVCLDHAKLGENSLSPSLDSRFFGPSPSQVLYLIEVVYALLMPASATLGEDASDFQYNFLKSGGLPLVLSMLTRNNFLPSADMETRRGAYLNALKIAKLLLTAVGFGHVKAVAEACQPNADGNIPVSPINQATHDQALVLQSALQNIPNPASECMLRNVAIRLAQQISDENFFQASKYIPDICVIRAVQKIVWASGCGTVQLVFSNNDEISKIYEKTNAAKEPDGEDEQVCCEALEVMTLCFALMPTALDTLSKEKAWQTFIIDLLLHCHSKSVRQMAQEQFFLMATRCCMGHRPLLFFITLLFTVLGSTAKERAKHAGDYFTLLRHLLNYAYNSNINLPNAEVLLNNEIDWLKRIRDEVKRTGETGVEETILEGHLGVTKELLAFQTPEKKYYIGCEKGGANLIKELIDDFIFPASNVYLQYMKSGEFPTEQAIPVCSTPASINAGFELLVALAVGCVRNLKQIADTLTDMYYLGCETLTEWEYLPPVGPRPNKGFVGLKNAGATCYMNSVIQQLYMIPPIRNGILAIEGTGTDVDDDMSGDEKQENESNVDPRDEVFSYHHQFDDKPSSKSEDRKEYNIGVLRHLQVIFGHLAASRLQYYVPRGFWKQFRLWGEPVNLREQHDALEFFNSLVDSLDEALKALGHPPMLSKVLGGSFADQKICQGCPHRYECEESFTTLNVDIRNHQNLLDSMEQYVKGDLLEGANAYHCEKCNKKVDTVKRLLIKKLPPVLAIQLKRFDYDWERECAIKFNDYFEFPRELDMEPYTVAGVAKLEGDDVNPENQVIQQNEPSDPTPPGSSKYRLVGVLVHSGQASGGHYYSYIIQRNGGDGEKNRWYKFDDGDVTECKMDDEEEMKNQCFGGEYMGEVFDHMMKRMSYRRQKRWWNAYILFYERMDSLDKDSELVKYISELNLSSTKPHQVKMPSVIECSVRKQNVQFMHNRMQYSLEYFQFIKKLLTCNSVYLNPPPGQDHLLPEAEEIAMISAQLAARFLFSTGFHTKKVVRGPASDWYDALCILLRHSKNVRYWFAHNVLFAYPNRFSEYLLECPSAEVRGAFAKLIVFIAHFSLQDGPCPSPTASPGPSAQGCDNLSLSDHLLRAVLNLLRREVSEHGRHLQQYFNLFVMYANLGKQQTDLHLFISLAEKTQLLKLNVPATFMLVALDEGPGPPIKYQYAELGKLYTVVSQLVRCCDVSSRMQSSINGNPPLPNPYGDTNLTTPVMPVQQLVAEILFVRTSYVKKIIEDCSNSEETVKLLRFCCWENPQFSSTVLSELLWQVAYSYTYELRPYLDLLLQILLIEDSWQTHRIHNVLKGIPDDRDGLFDTIQRSKNHYQKRAYQCIKCMVALFSNCSVAYQILQSNGDLKRKWTWAVEWLGDELERRPYTGNPQYTYNNWSPPVQSNETSNGYFLERSHSARMTLAKACELCPEELKCTQESPGKEPDEQEAPDDQDSSPPEDTSLYPHSPGTTQFQQNNHPHGQPYTGPAAQHMNNPQRPGPASAPTPGPTQTPTPGPGTTPSSGPRAQENWDGTEEVTPAPSSTPAPAPPKE